MHITASYSVFHRLILVPALKVETIDKVNEYSTQPCPNFCRKHRPNKLHKQIGIQSFVLHGGNKMLDFRELLTRWAYY